MALVVPHVFINRDLLPRVIFSPGHLALKLAEGLGEFGVDVTLFTPGPADTKLPNINADMSYFEKELMGRGYGYMELLKKHPATFVALARQVQAELMAKVYEVANDGDFDVVHVYTNEEDIAMVFADFCQKPVLFTHHDPFNFLIKYKSVMPKYKYLSWISMSQSQRLGMPEDTNWVANIHHGVDPDDYVPRFETDGETEEDYFAFVGRIIEPKGVHLAIEAVKLYNKKNPEKKTRLRIAGKHYSDSSKDKYWSEVVEPCLGEEVEYVGFLQGKELNDFLARARALVVPSTFSEPFGMVTLEALASATPVIGLSVGATSEIIENGKTGFIIMAEDEASRIGGIAEAMERVSEIDRRDCRRHFEQNFTLEKMIREHAELYKFYK